MIEQGKYSFYIVTAPPEWILPNEYPSRDDTVIILVIHYTLAKSIHFAYIS